MKVFTINGTSFLQALVFKIDPSKGLFECLKIRKMSYQLLNVINDNIVQAIYTILKNLFDIDYHETLLSR